MNAQTAQKVAPSVDWRPARLRDPLSSVPGFSEPVLRVVSLPGTRAAAGPGATQRDRLGEIDFLHRLVMG